MAAEWTVQLTDQIGLDEGLAHRYAREVRERDRSDEVALLVPTQAAAEIARRIVIEAGADALLDARIMTFPQLAEVILVANRSETRPMTALQRELLIADIMSQLADTDKLGVLQSTWSKPGTLDSVGAVLDEIKRSGISSDDFPDLVNQLAPTEEVNAPIALIFERYQQRLHDLGLYDEPGLFWTALETLQSGDRKPLEDLKVLLVDGFTEFTTTQLEMLVALGETAEMVEIRLWQDPERPLMAPRTAETLRRVKERVSIAGEPRHPRSDTSRTGKSEEADDLERLRRVIFSSDELSLCDVDGSVEIHEVAGGTAGECRQIARKIKVLLNNGSDLKPNEVAIFLRSWDTGYDTALRQAFDWYGVPADFAHGPALSSVPAVQAALAVLDVVVGGWRRQDVIKLANNNYVTHQWAGDEHVSASQLDRLTLEAGITGGAIGPAEGKEAWDRGFQQLQRRLAQEAKDRERHEDSLKATAEGDSEASLALDHEELSRTLEDEDGNRLRSQEFLQGRIEALGQVTVAVDHLHTMLSPLEGATSLADAAMAFETVVDKLGIVNRAEKGRPEQVAQDLQGLERLSELLRSVTEAPHVLALTGNADARQFADLLRRACSTARLAGTHHRHSGVQVLDIAQAGLARFKVVVVCGLRDGVFPARKHRDVLYSDEARARLQEELPGLRPRVAGESQQCEDELLLYAAHSAADERIWITYPSTEPDGSPVLRSLYVDEIARHWQAPPEDNDHPSLVKKTKQSDIIVPLEEVGHYVEVLEAVQEAEAETGPRNDMRNTVGNLMAPDGLPTLQDVRALAEIEDERSYTDGNSVFAGHLNDEAIIARLGERFGPDHIFSASQLNTYSSCPMRSFLDRVLGLDAIDEPTEGIDPRDLGSIAHRILKQFFGQRAIGSDNPEPLSPDNLSEAHAQLDRCIGDVALTTTGITSGAEDVWKQTLARLTEDLHALVDYESEHGGDLVRAVEATFGNDGSFEVTPEEGHASIKLRGRIDRVDLRETEDGRCWVIWDFKSGNGEPRNVIMEGRDIQLAVYATAVGKLYPDEAGGACQVGYYRVLRPVGHTNMVGDEGELQAAIRKATEKVGSSVYAIRTGQFSTNPDKRIEPCGYCDFAAICRDSRKTT